MQIHRAVTPRRPTDERLSYHQRDPTPWIMAILAGLAVLVSIVEINRYF
jgi:hypothetical protein